jgi:hypothetical protein
MTDRQRQRELGRLWRAHAHAAANEYAAGKRHGIDSPEVDAAWKAKDEAYERYWKALKAAGKAGHRRRGGTVVAVKGKLWPTLKQARKR